MLLNPLTEKLTGLPSGYFIFTPRVVVQRDESVGIVGNLQTFIEAIQQSYPNIPGPVISAMAQNTIQGPLGQPLGAMAEAIHALENTDCRSLTGSEIKSAVAIIAHLTQRVVSFQASLTQHWSDTDVCAT